MDGNYYICHPNDYVSHHGVLGMKWGIRRYQNPDGSLTAAGRQRYGNHIGKKSIAGALLHSPNGQRLRVRMNKGVRKDYADVNKKYKEKLSKIKKSDISDEKKKAKIASLKADRKQTLVDINTDAANHMYPWQTKKMNRAIQSGDHIVGDLLLGNAGGMEYERSLAKGKSKGKAIVRGVIDGALNYSSGGVYRVRKYSETAGGKHYKDLDTKHDIAVQRKKDSAKARKDNIESVALKANGGKKLSKATQRTINDYNNLSDREFVTKYHTSKKRYLGRVQKYGDPLTRRKKKNNAWNEFWKSDAGKYVGERAAFENKIQPARNAYMVGQMVGMQKERDYQSGRPRRRYRYY